MFCEDYKMKIQSKQMYFYGAMHQEGKNAPTLRTKRSIINVSSLIQKFYVFKIRH